MSKTQATVVTYLVIGTVLAVTRVLVERRNKTRTKQAHSLREDAALFLAIVTLWLVILVAYIKKTFGAEHEGEEQS